MPGPISITSGSGWLPSPLVHKRRKDPAAPQKLQQLQLSECIYVIPNIDENIYTGFRN